MSVTGRVVVETYNPAWPKRAAAELAALRGRLGVAVTYADHIGSTAIPGMAAKDLIDLQLSVDDLAATGQTIGPILESMGFTPSPWQHDHIPAGGETTDDRDRRDWEKRLWLRRRAEPSIAEPGAVNLHVRRTGAANERFALLFRDWFRAHPEAIPAYAAFKTTLAQTTTDVDTYSAIKDPVVDLVIATAEKWATETGWTPHALL